MLIIIILIIVLFLRDCVQRRVNDFF